MGLEKDAVDLLEVDGAGAVADGLHQSTKAEVARAAEVALAGADDESERLGGERGVGKRDGVELPTGMKFAMSSGARRGTRTE